MTGETDIEMARRTNSPDLVLIAENLISEMRLPICKFPITMVAGAIRSHADEARRDEREACVQIIKEVRRETEHWSRITTTANILGPTIALIEDRIRARA